MLNGAVAASLALTVHHTVVKTLAVTVLCTAEVVSHRVDSQETDQRVQLANTILKWCPSQAPTMNTNQRESCISSAAASRLDAMRFVEDDSPPAHAVEDTHL
mmetsp:Transcript_4826/g.8903  ORF Transcript_4826/g.8903 Transcript_4826/m.8903 type:complete len:102 (+) Transcript_4826:2340-2645(+)